MSMLPSRVRIVEVGPRDGLQVRCAFMWVVKGGHGLLEFLEERFPPPGPRCPLPVCHGRAQRPLTRTLAFHSHTLMCNDAAGARGG
jgi:hypothetical protein